MGGLYSTLMKNLSVGTCMTPECADKTLNKPGNALSWEDPLRPGHPIRIGDRVRRFSSGYGVPVNEGLVHSQSLFVDVATVLFWLAVIVGIFSLYLTRRRKGQKQARGPGFWEVGDEESGVEDACEGK